MGKYQIVYADPPWGGRKNFRGRGEIKFYRTMNTLDIINLPIDSIADKNCALFLWVTLPMIKDGLHVLECWGFRYVTTAFVWVKRNKNSLGWFWGQGMWTRSNAELCLLGLRGNVSRCSASVHQIIDSPVMGHSRKPDEIVRDRIVALVGDLPRVELFARRKVDGWDSWGNEVESSMELKV